MKSIETRPLRALVLAAFLGFTLLGAAQAGSGFSKVKLDAFITAAVAVDALVKQWLPRINGAESQAQAQQLEQQAQAELIAAIEATEGMTLQEYREIGQAAKSDPMLSAELSQMFNAKLGN